MITYDDYLLYRSFSYLTKMWLGKNEAQTVTYTCLSGRIRDRAGPIIRKSPFTARAVLSMNCRNSVFVSLIDPCNLLNAILTPKPHTRQRET